MFQHLRIALLPAAFLCVAIVLLAAGTAAQPSAPLPKPAATGPAPTLRTTGAVEAVTVYRGQAVVTRVIRLDLPAGASDLVVTDLPEGVLGDSLSANADNDAQVRAVRYRTEALREEPREDVRRLSEQIDQAAKTLRADQNAMALLQQKLNLLANVESFGGTKVKEELVKNEFKPDALKGMTEFIFAQRTALAAEALELAEKYRVDQEQMDLLQRKLAELTAKLSRTAREAVVFLDKPAAGRAVIRLQYMVKDAGWSPTYSLRASGGKDVVLEYGALVSQLSGENWDKVSLTLSTASPSMLAEAPILTPLWVTLGQQPMDGDMNAEMLQGGQRAAGQKLQEALRQRVSAASQPAYDQMRYEYAANEWANRLQIMDLIAGKEALMATRDGSGRDEALSVNYPLSGALSILSRADQQMIQIASLKLQGDFYYQAAPVLTPYVYQHADIVNTSDVALLPGLIAAYMGGQYVGIARIPMVAKGQRFTAGFGVDSQLRVTRELIDKTDRTQTGNRELTFKYRLLVDNYKDQPVKVRVLDRLPDPKSDNIRVTLIKSSVEVSDDPVYQRSIRKSGILRWDIDVPAKSAGATSKVIEYEYKIEFDRNLHLSEPAPAMMDRNKAEFEEQLRMMQK